MLRNLILKRNFSLLQLLSLPDLYAFTILGIYSLLIIIFFNKIEYQLLILCANIFIAITIFVLSRIELLYKAEHVFRIIRGLYFILLVIFIYSQTQIYIKIINPYDYDGLLIKWDYSIFGVNPTVWVDRLRFPLLTEYFQISYFTFFLMPLIHGLVLYVGKRNIEYDKLLRMIPFAFFLSYFFYFILPAVGPRFTIHNFFLTHIELPGIFFTDYIRYIINFGGGIYSSGVANPADIVNRDCMPSGHTMLTLVNMFMAYKFKTRCRWIFYLFGFSLILSTIYLRYHYVVDIIAGAVCAVFAIWFEPKARNFFIRLGIVRVDFETFYGTQKGIDTTIEREEEDRI